MLSGGDRGLGGGGGDAMLVVGVGVANMVKYLDFGDGGEGEGHLL